MKYPSKLKLLSHPHLPFPRSCFFSQNREKKKDQTEYYKLQTLTQLINFQFLKKVTQLLLSVSVFSLFFYHSSLLSFPQSFAFYFSTLPFQLFSHTIDKNCIFLLCNGLLVFLAKYSGLIRYLSGSSLSEESFKSVELGLQSESSISETKEALLENEVMEETVGSAENVALEQGREIDYLIKEVEKETEKSAVEEGAGESKFFISKEEEAGIFVSEDEKEQKQSVTGSFIEEEGNEMLSTEDINKKFDDFIRRMKEEIRIEAQRQLVMV